MKRLHIKNDTSYVYSYLLPIVKVNSSIQSTHTLYPDIVKVGGSHMSDELFDTVVSVDQADLEQRLVDKAKKELADEENRLDEQRLERTEKKLRETEHTVSVLKKKIGNPRVHIEEQENVRERIKFIEENQIAQLRQDVKDIRYRIKERKSDTKMDDEDQVIPNLVKLGKITPFAKTEEIKDDDFTENLDHQSLSRPDEEFEPGEIDGEPIKKRDDGIIEEYNLRLQKWNEYKESLTDSSSYKEYIIDKTNGKEFKAPGEIWKNLFGYQRTGVRWLWELYCQKVGGIIGDEMGLGKTVQVVAFIAALQFSNISKRPALIICPATVMEQWLNEFRHWWPPLRVAILHSTGSAFEFNSRNKNIGTAKKRKKPSNGDSDSEYEISDPDSETDDEFSSVTEYNSKKLIDSIFETGHVLITTYSGIKRYQSLLVSRKWGYCCLDEGHNIRNPDSEVSLTCKRISTPYRLILSGTPIQNKLVELWSLFDFVYPGRLGTLPVFSREFDVPIQIGGYAKATNIQVQTAYKCAVVLKDMISPYMLRRMKCDVASDLPKKTEKVLFCRFTKIQKRKYQEFVKYELDTYVQRKRNLLAGIDTVRKICNHPDLVVQDVNKKNYGDPSKSGKMQVVKGLLNLWKSQGHKALLFSQSRQMLDILDSFVGGLELNYLRMDGSTPVAKRQQLINEFNNNSYYDLFLLTTKVGGLGVNLTGANRVIIFDPDWNPSNDVQARERAWRLGQKKDVLIYRLITAGTIEERIYERQIYKQYLSNKILKDPKQKRFFKNSDLHDLLSLRDESESAEIFANANAQSGNNNEGSVSELDTEKKKIAEADDLSKMAGVTRETDYEQTNGEGESSESRQESSLLQDIFTKAGVKSSLQEDAVNNASRPDTLFMEREAERVAYQAAVKLNLSRKEAQKAKIGTPTWTGKAGLAGKNLKASNSSSKLLNNLRKQKELETKSRDNRELAPSQLAHNVDILERIQSFLRDQPNHEAKSGDIISNCNLQINGTQEVLNLRQMLRKIADWEDKKWKLKPGNI
ncbi:DNA-dependent ATPase [Starmerella bacillaris]|uniref:DNA-dependent ATPase n=1 Tax=Starmerella bacillaris TaxID=1247836 RepID=A0AAV5RQD6_STABA|nr:DNA-dependent ATPase [Starmerella bacillaris]